MNTDRLRALFILNMENREKTEIAEKRAIEVNYDKYEGDS